jgi:aminopeptidase
MASFCGFDKQTLERFADLMVGFGANVQKGQIVAVGAEIGKEEVARALAASAYRHGARFVDVGYFDPHVKHARLANADPETLEFVPSWYGERILALGDQRCARIGLSGPTAPSLFDDIDPGLVGKDQLPAVKESGTVVNDATTNWTIGPCPSEEWAALVFPDLDPSAALERLAEQLVHVCRLDEADPVAAWRERAAILIDAAAWITGQRFDALHFEAPGTDLTVGLLPTSKFLAAQFETVDGIKHMPNIPSEEIFSVPDPQRTEGVVRATKPLVLGGSIIEGLEVEFSEGHAIRIDADKNAEILRGYCERDEGASRLGEVALVDGEGRIGKLGTTFFDTLLDENAASHIALGSAYGMCLDGDDDRERINLSRIHVDFMIGSQEMVVSGVDSAGSRSEVLREGRWSR